MLQWLDTLSLLLLDIKKESSVLQTHCFAVTCKILAKTSKTSKWEVVKPKAQTHLQRETSFDGIAFHSPGMAQLEYSKIKQD